MANHEDYFKKELKRQRGEIKLAIAALVITCVVLVFQVAGAITAFKTCSATGVENCWTIIFR